MTFLKSLLVKEKVAAVITSIIGRGGIIGII
jgi:hypothetical protein